MMQATPPGQFASPTPVERDDPPSGAARPAPPRIYHVPLSMVSGPAEWATLLDGCAGMGFDTVMISPPGAPGPTGDALLPADWSRPHPALPEADAIAEAVAALAKLCRARGLALGVDLAADRVAAGSPLARELGLDLPPADPLDPRVAPEDRGAAPVPFGDEAVRSRFADLLTDYAAALAGAGATLFRCLAPERVPAALWAAVGAAVRRAAPGARLLAWTPGLPAEAVAALGPAGFDGSFSSLRWWDCRASWPVDEHQRLSALGPVIAFPEAPFGERLSRALITDEIATRTVGRALSVAATLGDGILVPMGVEFGARERVASTGGVRETYAALRAAPRLLLAETVRAANAFLRREGGRFAGGALRLVPSAPGAPTGVLRMDAGDLRAATAARLVLVNPSLDRVSTLAGGALSPEVGRFLPFRDAVGSGPNLDADSAVGLAPAAVRVLDGRAGRAVVAPPESLRFTVETAMEAPRLAIEAITPSVDGGRYAVKRTVGEVVRVEADAFGEGHDRIAVALRWRAADEDAWRERRMAPLGNDRWAADMPLERLGRHTFVVETWRDDFAMFHHEIEAKHEAGLAVPLELEEGRRLVARTLKSAKGEAAARLKPIAERLEGADDAARLAILLAPETEAAMMAADPRPFRLTSAEIPVDAERTGAGFASWYSIFPRSQSGDVHRHGTFDDVIAALPRVRAMGFDVLYFTPIHPIGRTNRKGRNNTLTAGPDDPGSPYAIGAAEGGHSAIHPELGDFASFRRLVAAAADHGLELALDIAIQASPDHPWLKDHPDWFNWRPDGTIRYAENPPKKYEDIVNVDFFAPGAMPSLWVELRDMMMLWVEQGVKLFRVDNPHTKPFPFWEWAIADIRRTHPDVVFLSEAFTKPKVMYKLAKIGFSQSYTYFTWRNTKYELTEYLSELANTAPRDFFRPHFFVNTHDINPDFLQNAPRSAFLIRAALAATLSGLWGVYNGFELCEGRPDAKRKEYADSEKYQLTAWDYDRPGNIVAEIAALNRIRRDNPALHTHLGITFRGAYNDNVLLFQKTTPSRDNCLLIAVSLDPYNVQEADIEVPLWEWGLPDGGTLAVEDLFRKVSFTWTGKIQRIRLDPNELPFSIWRLSAARDL
ncbi:alpha-1,4-glucan--maltose-1-phosphate maltosyltransferase [Lichenibacterium dinghuense]|uniref:alpha-1,4-glucan--maltose-1-phosphate maltosyltransferase n=1 Tax=Lichenibacterium dinghuense TaxID=2895977 RepID=UPI001F2090B1|nr:alpha-1,4-glucan--maltose-1-phosphate maltosyltransferase [Lichenibacterium sp. 6Y81]